MNKKEFKKLLPPFIKDFVKKYKFVARDNYLVMRVNLQTEEELDELLSTIQNAVAENQKKNKTGPLPTEIWGSYVKKRKKTRFFLWMQRVG